MRNSPLLDYRLYRNLNDNSSGTTSESPRGSISVTSLGTASEAPRDVYRFTGNIESITDGNTLWVRSHDLTLPVSLEKTKCYLLPKHVTSTEGSPLEGDGEPEAPEQMRWNRISALSEGVKVFVAGVIKEQNKRQSFCSTKEIPLTVIFYSCPDEVLLDEIIISARTKGEYWNSITPISIATGALSLIFTAATYLGRPAFNLAVISAFIAVFIPVFPVLPPGILLTLFYQRLSQYARKMRIKCDLALLKLTGEAEKETAKRYAIRAYSLEFFAWVMVLLGIVINIVFIFIILSLFQVISF